MGGIVAVLLAIAQIAAGLAGVAVLMEFGLHAGLPLAAAIIMLTPLVAAWGGRTLLRSRCVISPFTVAAPVWVAAAGMSWLFTSYDFFLSGDVPHPVAFLILAVAAIVGAIAGTRDLEMA